MASEISWRGITTGATDYATIRSAARTYWNTSGTPALEALTVANWAYYAITLTETPASSYFYVGTWPAGLTTAGWYWVDVYKRVGGSPAISDTLLGTLLVYWNGTTADPWDANLVQWIGTVPLALSSQQVQAVVPTTQKVDLETIKTRAITDPGAGVAIGTNVAQVGSAMALTSGERSTLAATIWTLANAIATGISPAKAMLITLEAVAAGKTDGATGGAGTFHVRDISDLIDRVTATVDEFGNRGAVTLDLS